jgi:hypothetical protein
MTADFHPCEENGPSGSLCRAVHGPSEDFLGPSFMAGSRNAHLNPNQFARQPRSRGLPSPSLSHRLMAKARTEAPSMGLSKTRAASVTRPKCRA